MSLTGVARRPVAALATYINGYPFKPEQLGPTGTPVVRIKQLLDPDAAFDYHDGALAGRYRLTDGDLVFSWSGSLAVQWWERGDAFLNQHLFRVVPSEGIERRWLRYALDHALTELEPMRNGSAGMSHVTLPMLKMVKVPTPSLVEQRRIADFLDDQVERLEELKELRSRQIRLRQDALDGAVSDVVIGLRAGNVERLRYMLEERDDRCGEFGDVTQLLSVSIHRGVIPRLAITDDLPRADDLSNYKLVEPGDIVLNRMRAFQGGVGIATMPGIVSPDYAVLTCGPRLLPEYAHFLFRSRWFVGEMISRLRGIGSVELGSVRTPRINVDDIREIVVPIPSLNEQRDTVAHLTELRASTARVVEVLERSVELLDEYQRSLITAAVTGELDVTTARPGVPA